MNSERTLTYMLIKNMRKRRDISISSIDLNKRIIANTEKLIPYLNERTHEILNSYKKDSL
jgi:hypothetical protein